MKCKLCQNEKFDHLFSKGDFQIERCTKCGLVRTFGDRVSESKEYHRDSDYKKYEKEFVNIFKLRFNRIKEHKKLPGNVLDVGCSTGLLLELFKKEGWEAWGVEPSGSAKLAKKRGINVVKKNFENADLKNNYFDVVLLNHTLEHTKDPFKVLKKVNKLLKKGGVLYVDVPNFGSWDRVVRQMHWPYLLPEEHVHHFDRKSLTKLINKSGFRVKKVWCRSGLLDVANPVVKIELDFKNRPIAFINDVMDLPGNLVTTVFNKGNSLGVIAVK